MTLSARSVLEELKACGATFCVGLADTALSPLAALLENDPSVRFVPVTREGEAFALASGLWVGGQNPVILAQNTGLLESGDGLRGTVQRMRVPVLCLITYRGYSSLAAKDAPAPSRPRVPDDFSRPSLDSAALITEPTLSAWGVPFGFLKSNADLPKIRKFFRLARRESRAAALLVTKNMT